MIRGKVNKKIIDVRIIEGPVLLYTEVLIENGAVLVPAMFLCYRTFCMTFGPSENDKIHSSGGSHCVLLFESSKKVSYFERKTN